MMPFARRSLLVGEGGPEFDCQPGGVSEAGAGDGSSDFMRLQMLSLRDRMAVVGFRLECLKLAISLRKAGEDPVELAAQFADFVLGKSAE